MSFISPFSMNTPSVPHSHEDRQWDIRVNVQDPEYLEEIIQAIMEEHHKGRFRYVLVGGVEIGDNPRTSDFGVKHVHIAVIFHNRASKGSIIKNWKIKEGNGYYMVPRNRELPYDGWREHHIKQRTKVNPVEDIILEYGDLPVSAKRKAPVLRSEDEKRKKTDEVLIHMRELFEQDKEEEAWKLYPRNYLMYGEKIKSKMQQKLKNFFGTKTDPHIYLFGTPGSGKTSLLKWIYPRTYKKDLSNRFFDLYDDSLHDHVILEDLDMDNIEKLSVQFLKTICDEGGFPIDQKYKTPQITRSTILITSNYSIDQLINPDNTTDVEGAKKALKRRFFHLRVDALHRLLGIKLLPEYERKQLKKEGNEDPSKLYMSWDWVTDSPTGEPLKDIIHYQTKIRDTYYG